jgi:ABC-2 type transport system ATP-binding protein
VNAPPDWEARVTALPHVESVTAEEHLFRIASSNGPATTLALVGAAATAGVTIASLSVQSTTLDDVFVHYTGRALRDGVQAASAADSPFMIRR